MIPELNGDFIQWLRGFYYTVETGSLMAATTHMHRNQSAITYQIQSLESMFGVPLFTGTKGKRVLTEEGKFLYIKAIELFGEIEGIRSAITQSPQLMVGEIRLTAPNSVLEYYLPTFVADFRSRCPGAKFILEGIDSLQFALRMFDARQADFGIFCGTDIPDRFEVIPLFTTEVLLITPRTGPYALTAPEPEQLTNIPFIAPLENSNLGTYVRNRLAYLGLRMNREILSSDTAGAKEFVAAGLGIAFALNYALDEADHRRFNTLSIPALFRPATYSIVYRKGMAQTYLSEEFLRCLQHAPVVSKIPPNTPLHIPQGEEGHDSRI